MRRLTTGIAIIVVLVVVAGAVMVAAWDIPAPTSHVEKVIPDDRFAR
jgi:hypothetical protein